MKWHQGHARGPLPTRCTSPGLGLGVEVVRVHLAPCQPSGRAAFRSSRELFSSLALVVVAILRFYSPATTPT